MSYLPAEMLAPLLPQLHCWLSPGHWYINITAFDSHEQPGHLCAQSASLWEQQGAFSSFVFLACRHKYEFLHSGMTPDIRITIPPRRIGVLLDYENCRLSFFNADIAQHLHTFNTHFQHYVHPCFALETPGILRIHTGITTPPWTALP